MVLLVHFLTTLARLLGPGGTRAVCEALGIDHGFDDGSCDLERILAAAARGAGKSMRAIAAELGVSAATVHAVFREGMQVDGQ